MGNNRSRSRSGTCTSKMHHHCHSSAMLFLFIFTMLISNICSQQYFNYYENVRISSGIFIETISLQKESYGHFYCMEVCRENAKCMMVTHETANGPVCNLWTFNETNKFIAVYDEKATLYFRRIGKDVLHFFCERFTDFH